MDARRPLGEFDHQMLEWTRAHGVPVHLLLTKVDKLNRAEATAALKTVTARVGNRVTAQLFSATTKTGLEEARQRVEELLSAVHTRPD
jgi:GTP-binding protein